MFFLLAPVNLLIEPGDKWDLFYKVVQSFGFNALSLLFAYYTGGVGLAYGPEV